MAWLLAAVLCHVAWSDMVRRRIPNADVLLLLCLGGAMAATGQALFAATPSQAGVGALVAVLGTLPWYAMRWMGAGDVKLSAALGGCVGWPALAAVGGLSVALALVYGLGWRCLHRAPAGPGQAGGAATRPKVVPYGAALCVAVAVCWAVRWHAQPLAG